MFQIRLVSFTHVVRLFAAILMLGWITTSVSAQSPLAPAQGFNIFIRNNSQIAGSEVQGPVALGGNITIAADITVASQNAGTFKVGNVPIGLLIGGRVNYQSGNNLNVYSNSYVKIGDCTGSVAWYKDNNSNSGAKIRVNDGKNYGANPGINLQQSAGDFGVSETVNPVCQGNLLDFETAFGQLKTNSTSNSNCPNNAELTDPNGNSIPNTNLPSQVKIKIKGGTNVLNITGDDLNRVTNFTFTGDEPDDSHVLLINVNASGNFTWNVWNQAGIGDQKAQYILYNFYNTTNLTIAGNSSVWGSILAPFATVTKSNSNNIYGQIAAQAYFQSQGSVNYQLFKGNLKGCSGCTLPTVSDIIGANAVCKSEVTQLQNATAGGVWSSDDSTIARVDANGLVKGVIGGVTTIRYTVTNSCGSSSAIINMTVNIAPIKPIITAGSATDFCPGGSVVFTSSALSGNQWYLEGKKIAGANDVNYTATLAGRYSLVATNNFGCGSVPANSVYVNYLPVPAKPIITAGSATTFCDGGSVDLTSSAATNNQWYKNGVIIRGATNNKLIVISSGSYTVNALNPGGCASVPSDPLIVTVNSLPVVSSIVGPNSACVNATSQFTNATNAGVWSTSNENIATINATGLATGVAPGYVDIIYTITNASGCVNAATKSILVNASPVVSDIVGPTNICTSNNYTYNNSTSNGVWSVDNTSIATISSAGVLTAIAAGNVNVQYIVTSADGCSSAPNAIKQVSVSNSPIVPTISASGNTSFCAGSSVLLSATNSNSSITAYQWVKSSSLNGTYRDISNATQSTYNATSTGYYKLVYYNAGGCNQISDAINVQVNAAPSKPIISAGGSTSFCQGGSVILSSSATTGNQWYKNAVAISGATNQTYTATEAGSYTVITTNASACSSSASEVTLVSISSVPSTPIITINGSANFCVGSSVDLSSNLVSGNQWLKDGTAIPGATNQTYTATGSGSYTVVNVNTDGCSSAMSSPAVITVSALPTLPSISANGPLSFCDGGSVILTATSSDPNPIAGYQWYKSSSSNSGYAIIAGATNSSYTATTSGYYKVEVSNAAGCKKTSTTIKQVIVNALPATPVITAGGPTSFCQGGSVVLTSSAGSKSKWYKNAVFINTATSITANSAGSYTVTITSTQGCSSSSTAVTVTVNALPTTPVISTPDPTTYCVGVGNPPLLTSSANTGNQWYLNGTIISGATNKTYSAAATGIYTVTTTNAGSCTSTPSDGIEVVANTGVQVPLIAALGSTTFCEGGSVVLVTSTSINVQWYKDGSLISGATNKTLVVTASGTYTVTATDPAACVSGTSLGKVVTVNPLPNVASITGNTTICVNATSQLSSATTSGVWSSSDESVASVNASGLVTAGSAGTATITYTVTNTGCSSSVTTLFTVNALPTIENIDGPSEVCVNATITLTSATAGGVWSSDNNSIATVNSSTGVVTGFAQGGANISYTVTNGNGCSSTSIWQLSVNPLPTVAPILGTTAACTSEKVLLSNATAGGVWSSSNTAIALVNNSGEVTAVSAGTTQINYIVTDSKGCSSAPNAFVNFTVNIQPNTPSISASGPTNFCSGGSVTFTASVTGGAAVTAYQWLVATGPFATYTTIPGATSATYTATSEGYYKVMVYAAGGCGKLSSSSYHVVVYGVPDKPTIFSNGSTTFCEGGTVSLATNTADQYQWYKNAVAIVGETNQILNVTTSGTYTLVTSNSNACSSVVSDPIVITVNPLPANPTITAGSSTTFCKGGKVVLTSSSLTGNQWYKNNVLLAGATAQKITAQSAGVYHVVVTDGNACSSVISNLVTVVVNPIPASPIISANGPTAFCDGNSVTLSSTATTGNQWYRNGILIPGAVNANYTATVAGNYTDYTTSASGCTSSVSNTKTVKVYALPIVDTIISANSVCVKSKLAMQCNTPGGTWESSNTAIATIDATSGLLNALTTGTTTVSYTVRSIAGCITTVSKNILVNPLPTVAPITGPTSVCIGGFVKLENANAGGVWSSDNDAIATVSGNGVVDAVNSGQTTIRYFITDANGCSSAPNASTVVNVNDLPSAPGIIEEGNTSFCAGGSVTLKASVNILSLLSYQWLYASTAVAPFTAIPGATSNTYTATIAGFYKLSVTNLSGCSNTSSNSVEVVVNDLPAIPTIAAGGPTTFCAGSSVLLTSSSATGNTWYRDGVYIFIGNGTQTYNATSTGLYSVVVKNASGCSSSSANIQVTANDLPIKPIIATTDSTTFCAPGSVTINSSYASGNQWYKDAVAITGATAETYVATASGLYTVIVKNASGCSSLVSDGISVTANTSAQVPIIFAQSPTTFCDGGSVNLISSSSSSNQWFKDGIAIAGATGKNYVALVSGSYTVNATNTTGCVSGTSLGKLVTVNPIPTVAVITGPSLVCVNNSITLSNTSIGGVWSSNDLSVATVNATTGLVTGLKDGIAQITYAVTSAAGCIGRANYVVTVVALPSVDPISGPASICVNNSALLTSTTGGGVWASSNTAIATVDSKTGLVKGISTGTVLISYTVQNASGCVSSDSWQIQVNAPAALPAITGPSAVCVNSQIQMANTVADGDWNSINPSIADINGTGLVTGMRQGTALITYTVTDLNACVASVSKTIIVNSLPVAGVITGTDLVCVGSSTQLSSSVAGGVWQSSNTNIATINASTGLVNGISAGTITIKYTVTNASGCQSFASMLFTVNSKPAIATITAQGPLSFCTGGSVVLSSNSATGNTWYKDGSRIIAGNGNQTYTATKAGVYTVTVTNNTGCVSDQSAGTTVVVNALPVKPIISTNDPKSFCIPGSATLSSDAVSGNQWYKDAVLIVGATAKDYIATTTGYYTVKVTNTSGCVSAESDGIEITANASAQPPSIVSFTPSTFCDGGNVLLISSSALLNQWTKDGIDIPGATNRSFTATVTGSYTVRTTNVLGCVSGTSPVQNVSVLPLPAITSITGIDNICVNAGTTLYNATGAGVWSSVDNSIASVDAVTGEVIGMSAGVTQILYTVSNSNCSSTTSFNLTVNALPAIPIISAGSATSFCAGGSVILTSNSLTGNQWFKNGIAIVGAVSNTLTVTSAGIYSLQNSNSSGCSSMSANLEIIVNPIPPVSGITGDNSICVGSTGQLTNAIPNGVWSSSNNSIATINSDGIVSGIAAGTATMTYTVTNNSGCSNATSYQVQVLATPQVPVVTALGPTIFCDGGLVLLQSSSTLNNQWIKDGSIISDATGEQLLVYTTGVYSVIVSNDNGCVSNGPSAALQVTVNALPAKPVITSSGNSNICNGSSVVLTSSSISGNQWYKNSVAIPGETSQNYTATETGSYTVVVTNSNGCSSLVSDAFSVSANQLPANPTISADGPNAICIGNAVVLRSSTSVGNQWYKDAVLLVGEINDTYVASSAGRYTVIATNESGCSSLASNPIDVTVNSLPVVANITGADAICSNSNTLYSNTTVGGQWSSENESIALVDALTGEVSGVAVGTTNIFYTVTDGFGCVNAVSKPIEMLALASKPAISYTDTTSFCAGSSINLTSTIANAYQWYDNGVAIVNQNARIFTATTTGSYAVSVVGLNGCSSLLSDAVPVYVNQIPSTPTVTANGPTTFCFRNSVVLVSSAETGNSWYLNGVLLRGSTGKTLRVTSAGDYTVSVTNSNGCNSGMSNPITVTVNPLPVIASIVGPKSVCINSTIDLTNATSGGVWASGNINIASINATGTVTGIAAGFTNISYTVLGSNGCSNTANSLIKVSASSAAPQISNNSETSFCSGGSVDLQSNSQIGNQWYNNAVAIVGAVNQTYTATASGNYSVVVSTGNGCVADGASNQIPVTVFALPSLNPITGSSQLCLNTSTQLSNSTAGGVWTSSDENILTVSTTGLLRGLSVGTAIVTYTVTNSNGCVSSENKTITVNAIPSKPDITAGGALIFCSGGSVVLSSSAASSYQWYLNSTIINGANAQTYSATATGWYTVIVTNASGCTSAESNAKLVLVRALPATPSITADGSTTFCSGKSVTLTSSNAIGNQWYKDAVLIPNETNQTIKVSTGGTYTVVSTNNNGCVSATSAPVVITVNPLPQKPVIVANGPTVFCVGGSVVLTSSIATTYQWYKDGLAQVAENNQTYTATKNGFYVVAVTTGNGCNSPKSNGITVKTNALPAKPKITINTPPTFCNGDSVVMRSNATSGNQWYKDGLAIAGATSTSYTAKTSGVYYLITSNSSGCFSIKSLDLIVTVNPVPAAATIVASGSTTICLGNSVDLTSNALSGNQWYRDGSIIAGASSNIYTANLPGSYTVKVSNNTGCASGLSNALPVKVNAIPAIPSIATSGPTTFCAGASVVLTSSVASAYQWYKNNVAIVGATSQTYTALSSGAYSVTVFNSSGCSRNSSSVINVNAVPLPTGSIIGNAIQLLCTKGSIVLEAVGGDTYKWFKDGTQLSNASTNKLTVTQPGQYSAVLVNAQGCEAPADKVVSVVTVKKPVANFVFDTYCARKEVNFQSTSDVTGSGPVNYQWTNGFVGSESGSSTATFVYPKAGTYYAKLVVTPWVCPLFADSIIKQVVIENPLPAVRMPSVDVAIGGTLQLKARANGTAYLWTPADNLSSSTISNPIVTGQKETDYKIKIDMISGCSSTDTLLVRIHNSNTFYIPSVFSPNGDGLNDKLMVNYVGIKEIKYYRIYNRWGNKLFETKSMFEGWDGTANGILQPMESYNWVVDAIDVNGKIITRQGTVTLLR